VPSFDWYKHKVRELDDTSCACQALFLSLEKGTIGAKMISLNDDLMVFVSHTSCDFDGDEVPGGGRHQKCS
jgi:hypothetical protein